MKRIISRKTQVALRTGTDKLASALTNTLLYTFYLWGASFGKQGSLGVHRAFQEANEALGEFNYQSIKDALNQLKKSGLITRTKKRTQLEIEITQEGKKRIASLFPSYQSNRPWDGHVYLISYDIPAKVNHVRDILREYIRRTGGALLQESLWLNPYNPQVLLEGFIKEKNIPGMVLVSKLGHDGAIGDERLLDLIARIYHYPTLTERYNNFLIRFEGIRNQSPIAVAMEYSSILRQDPQLPFELEPKQFPGREAHDFFESIRHNTSAS